MLIHWLDRNNLIKSKIKYCETKNNVLYTQMS